MSIIKLKNVSKFYRNKNTISTGFSRIDLELDMGEFVVITGESGSGKSTLLNVISGLDSYEEGEMYINGEETSHYVEQDYEDYRRKYIGNIFQHFNLVNSYTVYQNIELVLLLNGYTKKDAKKRVLDIIETVGLSKYKNSKASKLSGGQKQRVAIARALAKDTPIIVADEPTGNLDVKSAKSIMKLLKEISSEKLVIVVTHNYEQAFEYATRKISMNDGKIIEDKVLMEHKSCKIEEVEYRDLSLANKVRLGFRNAFNIKTKFILLFLVYFFLTILVFGEYSSLRNMDYEESLTGYNNYFADVNPKRVVLSKKDRTPFNDDDLKTLENNENVEKIFKDDILLDIEAGLFSTDIYIYGVIKPLSEFNGDISVGSEPVKEDEIVVAGYEDSFYFTGYQGGIMNKTLSLQENKKGNTIGKVRITGIAYDKDANPYSDEYKIYISDRLLDKLKTKLNTSYANIVLSLNDKEYSSNNSSLYYTIEPSKNVKKGEAFLPVNFNFYCKDYTCLNKSFQLRVDNMYFKDEKTFTAKELIDKDNYKNLLKVTESYDSFENVVFISEEDYEDLFFKGDYQVSVYMRDDRESDNFKEFLKNNGYDFYFLKEHLLNPAGELMGILKTIRSIFFFIAIVALFFISFFIIRIILKSRNVYYSTIRILGATKRTAKDLLNIELLIDVNVAYIFFLGIVKLASMGLISEEVFDLENLITFFKVSDYVIVYIILIAMSLLISNRYAKKLFKNSAMHTYREEV